MGYETTNLYRYGVQLSEEENEAGRISGDHGRDHPMERMGGNHQTVLSCRRTKHTTYYFDAPVLFQKILTGQAFLFALSVPFPYAFLMRSFNLFV